MLSENDRYLLNCYLKYKEPKFKKDFIRSFISLLSKLDENKLLKYVSELKDIIVFDIVLNISKGRISNIDFSMPTETTLKEKPVGYSKDFYFNDLVEKEDYDELFNLYGIDEISKYSNVIKKGN